MNDDTTKFRDMLGKYIEIDGIVNYRFRDATDAYRLFSQPVIARHYVEGIQSKDGAILYELYNVYTEDRQTVNLADVKWQFVNYTDEPTKSGD